MSATTALRARLKDKVEKEHGVKLSFMPFFVKAATMALKAYPLVNAQIDGDSIEQLEDALQPLIESAVRNALPNFRLPRVGPAP